MFSLRHLLAGWALQAATVVTGAALGIGAATAGHSTVDTIYVRNTSALPSAEVTNALPAFQKAIDKDFGPLWHIRAKLKFIGTATAPKDSQVIIVQDKMDVDGALAYHELSNGVPRAIIGYGVALQYGYTWTVSFTHELWEMLADPSINRTEQNQSSGRIWAAEVADPVESERDGYTRAGANGKPVLISDFVTDRWFGANTVGAYDFMGHVTAPEQIDPNGYAQWWDGTSWNIVQIRGSRLARLYLKGEGQ